ncbi:hypothetical protein HYU14_02270 [Candidatus Woesearchaeota archaeon]|nr:hypothetical protein [Candidatus Woesearchaeota archaeon]
MSIAYIDGACEDKAGIGEVVLQNDMFLAIPERNRNTPRGRVRYPHVPEKVYALGKYVKVHDPHADFMSQSVPRVYKVDRVKEGNVIGREVPMGSDKYNGVIKWLGFYSITVPSKDKEKVWAHFGFNDGEPVHPSKRRLLNDSKARAHMKREDVIRLLSGGRNKTNTR